MDSRVVPLIAGSNHAPGVISADASTNYNPAGAGLKASVLLLEKPTDPTLLDLAFQSH